MCLSYVYISPFLVRGELFARLEAGLHFVGGVWGGAGEELPEDETI